MGRCRSVSKTCELWFGTLYFICSMLPSNLLAGNLESYLRVSSKLKFGIFGDTFSLRLNSSSVKSRERAELDAAGTLTSGNRN